MFAPVTVDITDKELQQWVMNFCTESTNNTGFDFEKFKEKYGVPKALLSMQDQLRNPSN